MPFEIDLKMPPAGYSLSAARPDETVSVQFKEFTSTEDGQHFIQRLEGLPNEILQLCHPVVRASQVDNMLAICRSDGKATVYINEVAQRLRVRASRRIEAGQPVNKSDIVDVDRCELGVSIPDDVGVLFVFSSGWRKGLFYDFGPISGPDARPRDYDLLQVLGQAYCQVLFQERFSISDTEWQLLFDSRWFPFAALGDQMIDSLVEHVRSGWDPDEKLEEIVSGIKLRSEEMLESWSNHRSLSPHIGLLKRAVERFRSDDFESCTALLYPRIEGVLRTNHIQVGVGVRPTPNNLTDSAIAARIQNENCLLLPRRFAAYLRDIYFANFDPTAPAIDVSRHSVAHGVASTSEYNKKSATLGILILHQLLYSLENPKADSSSQ